MGLCVVKVAHQRCCTKSIDALPSLMLENYNCACLCAIRFFLPRFYLDQNFIQNFFGGGKKNDVCRIMTPEGVWGNAPPGNV